MLLCIHFHTRKAINNDSINACKMRVLLQLLQSTQGQHVPGEDHPHLVYQLRLPQPDNVDKRTCTPSKNRSANRSRRDKYAPQTTFEYLSASHSGCSSFSIINSRTIPLDKPCELTSVLRATTFALWSRAASRVPFASRSQPLEVEGVLWRVYHNLKHGNTIKSLEKIRDCETIISEQVSTQRP